MQWYYEKDGAQRGPVTEDELRAMLQARTAKETTFVWREGMDQWAPVGQVPDWPRLMPEPGTEAVSPYAPPVHGPLLNSPVVTVPNSGLAIASMVCGILSVILLLSCAIGAITAVPAVICGHMALSRIKREPPLEGRGMAIAGLVTGYLTLGITAAFVAVMGILMITSGNWS